MIAAGKPLPQENLIAARLAVPLPHAPCPMLSTHTAAFTYLRLARDGHLAGQGLLVFMPEIIFVDAVV
jgi:hypothetical protein